MLTDAQKQTAVHLLEIRPPVIPGTRAIVGDAKRKTWFDAVYVAMTSAGITSAADIAEFCDLAGVPD